MSQAPDPADKGVDTFRDTTHRGGYNSDPLAHAIYWARKGGTLQTGEGLTLLREIERQEREILTLQHLLHKASLALYKKLDTPSDYLFIESVTQQLDKKLAEIYGGEHEREG